MWSPKQASKIPSGIDLRCKLTYGEDNRSSGECFVFIEDVRGFRRTFRNSEGVSGQDFHDWKSHEHQRGLDEMTNAYLEKHGRGPMFWPSDPVLPYYNSSLQYSEHRSFIRKHVRLLFFRINLTHYRNAKYKESRSKSSDLTETVIIDGQGSRRELSHPTNGENPIPSRSRPDQPVLFNGRGIPVSVSDDPPMDPDLELSNQHKSITQSTDISSSSQGSLLPGHVTQEKPPLQAEDDPNNPNPVLSLKRPVASHLAQQGPKRTRSSYTQGPKNKSTVGVRSRPHRQARTIQPRYTTPDDYALATKTPSPFTTTQSSENNDDIDPPLVEPSKDARASPPRLLVRLKAPKALLMGLDARLNKPQDTEANLENEVTLPMRTEPAPVVQDSENDTFEAGNNETERHDVGSPEPKNYDSRIHEDQPSQTPVYEIHSTPPMAQERITSSETQAPMAIMEAANSTTVASDPPLTALHSTSQPELLPIPQEKPTFAVTCRIIISREDPHLNQTWEPEGGFRSMTLKRLTEHLPHESFGGIRFNLTRDIFRNTYVVFTAQDDKREFEVMKKRFGAYISHIMSQAKAGQHIDFELEIEPIPIEVDQTQDEESLIGQGW